MNESTSSGKSIALGAISYAIVGVATAEFAGRAATMSGRTGWRLTGWILSLAIFLAHVVYENSKRDTKSRTARSAAAAVGLAALVLAIWGPVRMHWGNADLLKITLLSVIAWPLMTAIPAFIAAWVLVTAMRRFSLTAPR